MLPAETKSPSCPVLTAFVGVDQLMFVALGACPASFLLGRVFGLHAQDQTPSGAIPR